MHKIVVDTEFTSLDEEDAKPISIALVDVASGDSCYVELDGWELWDCSEFVTKQVLPQLTGPSLTYAQASDLLLDFLEAHQPFELMSDAPIYDFPQLRQVLGSQCPIKNVSGLTDLRYLVADEEGDENPHHALLDAQRLASKYAARHFG
ncbi:hypothetical protein F3I62_18855 [Pseudomonas sp. R-28-1W-6]|uniref:3'-5' exoribonuclease n=1 Tax=Pseudomonas sp. R-28-1W-6 TaxID=2650101 RepID=UPI001365A997|nr:3'-5' exoribonuclease [Pseudomonas sp. R-28-1W-6]MWV14165.1 hypothetical protein [Pseudomonas sp. R-28-1W-6]